MTYALNSETERNSDSETKMNRKRNGIGVPDRSLVMKSSTHNQLWLNSNSLAGAYPFAKHSYMIYSYFILFRFLIYFFEYERVHNLLFCADNII